MSPTSIQLSGYQAGVNLGGWISQYPEYSHSHFRSFIQRQDIQQIADWGMDHVRLPVDYPVLEEEAGYGYIDTCLDWCKSNGLNLVLDLHHAPGFSFSTLEKNTLFNEPRMQEAFISIWMKLSQRYREFRDNLVFELLNEIVLPDSTPWNELIQRTVKAIRLIDRKRTIIIGGNHYNSASQLENLDELDDTNILYTFHCYEPMPFTHQKAGWVAWLKAYDQTVDYPGGCPDLEGFLDQHSEFLDEMGWMVGKSFDKIHLQSAVQPAIDFKQRTGRMVYCGEYGAIDVAPAPSRLRWHRDLVRILNENDIGHAVWSYKRMNFALVDENSRVLDPELVKFVSSVNL